MKIEVVPGMKLQRLDKRVPDVADKNFNVLRGHVLQVAAVDQFSALLEVIEHPSPEEISSSGRGPEMNKVLGVRHRQNVALGYLTTDLFWVRA